MTGSLLALRDYMSTPVHSVLATTPLPTVGERLDDLDVSALLVVDTSGTPLGVVSRTDLLRAGRLKPGHDGRDLVVAFPSQPVSTVMQPGVVTIDSDARLASAAALMVERHIHRVFVREAADVIGVVSTTDVVEAVADARIDLPIGELMSPSIVTVAADASIASAVEKLAAEHIRAVVVVEDGWPVGIFGQLDALAAAHASGEAMVEDFMDFAVLCLPTRMPAHRAAAHALAMGVEHVLATDETGVRGVLTGIDFARALR